MKIKTREVIYYAILMGVILLIISPFCFFSDFQNWGLVGIPTILLIFSITLFLVDKQSIYRKKLNSILFFLISYILSWGWVIIPFIIASGINIGT
ncbi:MAG: hypothetical protein KAS07_01780 [Candidatus Pacebacteria bacterium]|nr:hypothetical protein [Candidatus Paceibacterota bacterium]